MKEIQRHPEESFFLNDFNMDRVFGVIQRADYLFLYYIEECAARSEPEGRAYLSVLAEQMHMTIPALSKTVEKLQDKGYVMWKTDREAGKTYVQLSGRAVELMETERAWMKRCYERIREEIGEEELLHAAQTMKQITDILKDVKEETVR